MSAHTRARNNARAYVLIEAETGQLDTVVAMLLEFPEVVEADAVTGLCDVIALLESPDQSALGRLVISKIHGIAGVKRTTTCFAIR